MIFGRKIKNTKIDHPPIFILGHWRSGTTLLHELMVTNPSYASPNTFQCFAPSHFLLSEPLMVKFGGFLLPKQRPMDNMEAGWTLPQEDEFALMNLGVPTPYLRIAFPRTQPKQLDYLSLDIEDKKLEAWSEKFMWFLKLLTFHYGGRRLVLKSPTHTARVKHILRMFPNAKFIHLTREPTRLYSSTLRLWKSLQDVQALHDPPSLEDQEAYVEECLIHMYRTFEEDRRTVPDSQIMDIRYEDLAANPLDTVREVYERLELGEFELAEPALRNRLVDHAKYRPNQHQIDANLKERVQEVWPNYPKLYDSPETTPSEPTFSASKP